MPNKAVTLLLIENNPTSRQILLNQMIMTLPHVEVHAATTSDEALAMLKDSKHDIIVCDASLARDQRIDFVYHMCAEGDPIVIVITGDTGVGTGSFSAGVKETCVQHVAYKPLDLGHLMRLIKDAVSKAEARNNVGTYS